MYVHRPRKILMKMKTETVIPKEVIDRIKELSGLDTPKLVFTYDEVNFRILMPNFKRCLMRA